MSNLSKAWYRLLVFLGVCCVTIVSLLATGLVDLSDILDSNNEVLASPEYTSYSIQNNSTSSEDIPSALTIKLSGEYLDAFKQASKTISTSDTKSLTLIKVGLQILQSKTIKYENALHFYSLDYTSSGASAKAKTYSLKNCINRINNGERIYTDCFGFVRLVHSITCYTINNNSPESVSGISGLYGWKGAYSEGKNITSINSIKSGAVIYDTKTGRDAGYSSNNRHVAMYLYANSNTVFYMDQGGIKSGQIKNENYIYSSCNSTPYKFNKFKNYN